MLSSKKVVRPRGLRISIARVAISGQSVSNNHHPHPLTYQLSYQRNFSWGAKHKFSHKNAGQVWKGFSTQDHTQAQEQLYRRTFWNHQYLPRRHIPKYLRVQEWRLSSSWGKPASGTAKGGQVPASNNKTEEKAEADWYSRYQLQKKQQYDGFMKKMEEDPIGMLFGRRWANWVDGTEVKMGKASASYTSGDLFGQKSEKSTWDWGCGPPTSRQKTTEEKDSSDKSLQYGAVAIENKDQDYKIDPITNRKVPKTAPVAPMPRVATKLETDSMPEAPSKSTSDVKASPQESQKSFDIPVKRFDPHAATGTRVSNKFSNEDLAFRKQDDSSSISKPQDINGWLAQEGFGNKQESRADSHPTLRMENLKSKAKATKIESALDRHLQSKSSIARDTDRPVLQYEATENTTEDVDLLRPSDVRASAGLRGRSARESDVEKQTRQRKLEKEFDSRPVDRENQLAQELAKTKQEQQLSSKAVSRESTSEPISELDVFVSGKEKKTNGPRAISDPKTMAPSPEDPQVVNGSGFGPVAKQSVEPGRQSVQAAISEKANKTKAQIVPLKSRLDAIKADYDALRQRWLEEKHKQEEKAAKMISDMQKEEVKAQKVAMEAMEMRGVESTSKHDMAVGSDMGRKLSGWQLQSFLPGEGDMASNVHEFAGRDRWYKRKAPHANREMDAKLQQVAKDKALIQEVRGIYEDTYGTIDTAHRQPPCGEDVSKSLGRSEAQASVTPDTFSSTSKAAHSPDSCSATFSLPTTILDDSRNIDPLAVIKNLFDAVRHTQDLVLKHRSSLSQLTNPSESQMHDIVQNSSALAIIRGLISELRRAQFLYRKGQRTKLEQTTNSTESATMFPSNAYKYSVMLIARSAWKLASTELGFAKISRSLTTSAPKSKDGKPLSLYRILAFDTANQTIVSSKAASPTPFSKEQRILPIEALETVRNPAKFLPELMDLHNNGYTVVSGTRNTLVFKKPATPEEVDQIENDAVRKDLNMIDGTLPHWADYLTMYCDGPRHLPFTYQEIRARVKARREEAMGYPDSDPPGTPPVAPATFEVDTSEPTTSEPATSEPASSSNSISSTSGPATSGPATSDSATSASTASASTASGSGKSTTGCQKSLDSCQAFPREECQDSNPSSSCKVHREEAVFSGPARGNWEEVESKRFSKNKRARHRGFKRSQKVKNMLLTGTVTAACCYAVGFISQMMQQ